MRLDDYVKIYHGGTAIKKIYHGDILVWGKEQRIVPIVSSNGYGFGVNNSSKALAARDEINEQSQTDLTGISYITRNQYDSIITHAPDTIYLVQESGGDVNIYLGEIKMGGEF